MAGLRFKILSLFLSSFSFNSKMTHNVEDRRASTISHLGLHSMKGTKGRDGRAK